MIRLKLFCGCFLIITNLLFPQIKVEVDPLSKRLGDILKYNSVVYPYSNSGFMSSFSVNSSDEWTSPSGKILLNGQPFNCLPFNFNSLDLIPADMLQLASLDVNLNSSIYNGNSIPSGALNIFTRKITDSSIFQIRAFTGSETGDPLIHTFTRENVSAGNKNKIVPSGIVSFENKNGAFGYRITTGYFGYFTSNSSEMGNITAELSPALFLKQNKQILASVEFEYALSQKKKLNIFSSFISFYGWEIPPFITSPVHFESYLYTVRGTVNNLIDNLTIGFRKDGSFNKVKNLMLVPASGFILDEFAISPSWKIYSSNITEIKINGEVSLNSAYDLEINNAESTQKFFNQDYNKLNFYLSPSMEIFLQKKFSLKSVLKYDHHFINKAISGELSGNWKLDNNNQLNISASSIVRFPNLTELYGQFTIFRMLNDNQVSFTVSGNNHLKVERNNTASLFYAYYDEHISTSANIYFRKVVNPIYQKDSAIIKSGYPGDIVRNAIYSNNNNRAFFGVNLNAKAVVMENINAEISYSFIENRTLIFAPKNRVAVNLSFLFPFKGKLSVGIFYSDKRIFENFKTTLTQSTEQDYKLPSFVSFNLSYNQTIEKFYFFHNLKFRVNIENLFNQKIKHHPLGNYLDRAVEFFVYVGIY